MQVSETTSRTGLHLPKKWANNWQVGLYRKNSKHKESKAKKKKEKKKQPLQKMGQGPEQRTLRRRKKWLRTISKNVPSPQQLEKCKPNNSEISSHLSQDGKAHHHYQKQKLESMQAKGNPHSPLVELWTGRATMAISMQNCQPAQNKDATWPSCTTF